MTALALAAFGWPRLAPLSPPTSSTTRPEEKRQPLGSWRVVASLRDDRYGAAAVALADGRVLVVGGYSNPKKAYLRSAELWNPHTLAAKPTGSMTIPRAGHTATLLADGRVLVVGGESGGPEESGTEATAEIWDPASGRFTETAPMRHGRREHTAVRLTDGRVAVAGGGIMVAAVEVWSPISGLWQDVDRTHGDDTKIAALVGGGLIEVKRGNASDIRVFAWAGEGDPKPLATLKGPGGLGLILVDDAHVALLGATKVIDWNPRTEETREAPYPEPGLSPSDCWPLRLGAGSRMMCVWSEATHMTTAVVDLDSLTINDAGPIRPIASGPFVELPDGGFFTLSRKKVVVWTPRYDPR
jgi:hypothetical protein